MPIISTAKMTARQFLHMGEDPPGVTLELVNGEIAVSPSPRPRHSRVDRQLTAILVTHVNLHDLGEVLGDTDTIFGEFDVRRPDIIYFTAERAHLIREDEAIDGPPDLCVEIISPKTRKIDRNDKFKQYAASGVRYYWIIDPLLRTAEAYKLRGKSYKQIGAASGNEIARFEPFPDLDIPLGQLWFRKRRTNGHR
jgi:Uma2 family endonuclease